MKSGEVIFWLFVEISKGGGGSMCIKYVWPFFFIPSVSSPG